MIVAIIIVFIEATIAILAADFIQALTALAQSTNSTPNLTDQSGLSSIVIQLSHLGLTNVSLIFSALILFSLIIGTVGVIFSSKAISLYVANIRYVTYQKIQTFNTPALNHFSVPALVTRLTNDSELINTSFAFAIKFLPNGLFTLLFGLIKSIIDFGKLAIVYAIILPFLIVFMMIVVRKATPYFKATQINTDGLNKNVRETILGIRLIKSANLEDQEKAKFTTINGQLSQSSQRAYTLTGVLIPVIQNTINAAIVVILIIIFNSAKLSNRPEEFIKFGGFSAILMQVLFGFIITIATFVQIARAIPSTKRILEINKYQVNQSFPMSSSAKITNGHIKLTNVFYSYTNDLNQSVLKNINLEIKPNQRIGIVGPTGSGKTTLINLISRFIDPSAGVITIDNINLKNYSKADLNANIAVATQVPTLFSGTIKSNIAMGLPSHQNQSSTSEIIIEQVAKAAQAWAFISKKPNQLDQRVAQRGKNFSGGQKQRIAIARTLAKQAKIVIFDDATSALDTVTERAVQSQLASNYQATTIIVAQRISSVENLDKIVVLDQGQIVGFDSHWNLLSHNQTYRAIAASQIGTEELNKLLIAKGVKPIEKNSN